MFYFVGTPFSGERGLWRLHTFCVAGSLIAWPTTEFLLSRTPLWLARGSAMVTSAVFFNFHVLEAMLLSGRGFPGTPFSIKRPSPLRVLDAPVVLCSPTLPTPTQPAPHSSRCKKNRLAQLPQLHPAEERHPLKSEESTTQAPPLTAAPRPEKTT